MAVRSSPRSRPISVGAGEGSARAEEIARMVAEMGAGDGRYDASGEDKRDGRARATE
jgi:hypothetical protein